MVSYQEFTKGTDGALSFNIRNDHDRPWWWYLDLNGEPLFLISNACGTCEAIFERVRNLQTPIGPQELSTQLAKGLTSIPGETIQALRPLLPKGDYLVGLIELLPAQLSFGERPRDIGCHADYFWWRLFERNKDGSAYELVLPSVAKTALDAQRIAAYCAQIQQGQKPTALALSIVDERNLGGGRYTEYALAHFLLDGHHKVMAASQMGSPITLLSFLRETTLTGIPSRDEQARKYYSGVGWQK